MLQEFKSSQTVKINPDRHARFVALEVSRPVLSVSPQGAFTACAKVCELPVFTHTAEVKVDPDKPLEGVRLEVLQVEKQQAQQRDTSDTSDFRHFSLPYTELKLSSCNKQNIIIRFT